MTPAAAVLVVGSLHHDIMVLADRLPRPDETAVGHRWFPKFGGKGGNQAVAARAAGAAVRMLGAVGDDAFGAFMLGALDRGGVDRRWVRRLEGQATGISVAVQDATGAYAATIVSGANLALDPGWLDDPALWDGAGLLVLQNEIPAAVNTAAAQAARGRGLRVVLNAAPARALPPDLRAAVDVLVVNAVEAEMSGTAPVTDRASAQAAARQLAADVPAVVVTAGAQGLAAQVRGGAGFTLPAPRVAVAGTHGAGDCFTGTLAAALAAGADLAAACATATAAAARHVAGATGPLT